MNRPQPIHVVRRSRRRAAAVIFADSPVLTEGRGSPSYAGCPTLLVTGFSLLHKNRLCFAEGITLFRFWTLKRGCTRRSRGGGTCSSRKRCNHLPCIMQPFALYNKTRSAARCAVIPVPQVTGRTPRAESTSEDVYERKPRTAWHLRRDYLKPHTSVLRETRKNRRLEESVGNVWPNLTPFPDDLRAMQGREPINLRESLLPGHGSPPWLPPIFSGLAAQMRRHRPPRAQGPPPPFSG
jgi:hypothetical protein